MHHPTDRIAHTTAFVTPVVEHWMEREIAQWVHPMKDRSVVPSYHELLPRSNISLPKCLTTPSTNITSAIGCESMVRSSVATSPSSFPQLRLFPWIFSLTPKWIGRYSLLRKHYNRYNHVPQCFFCFVIILVRPLCQSDLTGPKLELDSAEW